MALFEIRNLTFTYPEAKTPALQEVNVAIEQGEFIVICGNLAAERRHCFGILKLH